MPERGTLIGVTAGLETICGEERPEQVYLWRDPDPQRPIRVEGWVGYGVPMRMRLTKSQAKALLGLLVDALVIE